MEEFHCQKRLKYTEEQNAYLDYMIKLKASTNSVVGCPESVVLVGGTNGKTTVTKLVFDLRENLFAKLLHEQHYQSRISSDINGEHVITAMFEAWKDGTHVIMEAWSRGWKLFRNDLVLCGYPQDRVVSIITNITQDHGDYHDYSMDTYAYEKFRTTEFSRCLVLHESLVHYYEKYGNGIPVIVYGHGDSADVQVFENGFRVKKWNFDFIFDRPWSLTGTHNLLNVTGACILVMEKWITANDEQTTVNAWPFLREVIESFKGVPGRLDKYTTQCKELVCISDYAHNPGGMEAVLQAVRPLVAPGRNLWCIFGCNENKDVKKRSMMGDMAFQYADKVVITSDHDGPQFYNVVDDILGDTSPQKLVMILEDRVEAIRQTLDAADEKDVILMCNMGTDLSTCQFWDDEKKLTSLSEFSISVAGDIIPHAGIDDLVFNHQDALLNICNFEGTVAQNDALASGYPYFAAPPSWVESIAQHFQVVSLCNNHSMDYGTEGLEWTRKAFENAGVVALTPQHNFALFSWPEKAVRVGIFAYTCLSNTPCPWTLKENYSARFIKDLEEFKVKHGKADVYIAYMHWGEEYHVDVSDLQINIRQALDELGFHVVVGCHAHVAQETHMVNDTSIYGLGNLISNHSTTRFRPLTDWQNGLTVKYDFVKCDSTLVTRMMSITSFKNDLKSASRTWPLEIPTEDFTLPLSDGTTLQVRIDLRSPCSEHFKQLYKQGYFIDTSITYASQDYDFGGSFMGCDSSRRCMIKKGQELKPSLYGIGFLEHYEGQVGGMFVLSFDRGRGLPINKCVQWFGQIIEGRKLDLGESLNVSSYDVSEKPHDDQGPLTYKRLELITHGEWMKRPHDLHSSGGIQFIGEPLEATKVWVCEHPQEVSLFPSLVLSAEGILVVNSRTSALRAAGRDCTLRFAGPIIRITGSSGKTTTRCITARLLQSRYAPHEILSNAMNYNNTLGVPNTVKEMTSDTKIMVLEMGISEPGEMSLMTSIAHGTMSTVLNVQHAHEANFESHADLVKEKMDIKRNNFGKFLDLTEPCFSNAAPFVSDCIDKLSSGRRKAFYAALQLCNLVGVAPDLAVVEQTIEELNDLIPSGRAHLYFKEPIWVLDDTYNGNPDSIANMIEMCAQHESPVVIVLAQVAECPPQLVTSIVGEALSKLKDRQDVYLFLGGEMYNWVKNHLPNTYKFDFANSIPQILTLLSPGSLLAVKGTGLFKKDPRWKMWEWLEKALAAVQKNIEKFTE